MRLHKLIIISLTISLGLILPFYFDLSLNSKTDLSKLCFLSISTVILLILWLILILKGKNKEKYLLVSSFDIIVFLYLFSTLIATLFSVNPSISLFGCYMRYQGLITHINYVLVFYLVLRFLSIFEWSWKLLIYTLVLSSSLLSVYAILQFKGIDPIGWEIFGERMTATFGNPVFLGAYLVTILPLCMALFLVSNSTVSCLFPLLCSCLTLFGLLLTQTRACFVGFLFALFIFFIFTKNLLLQKLRLKATVLALTLVLTTLAGSLFTKGGLIKRMVVETVGQRKEDVSLSPTISSPVYFKGSARLRLLMWEGGRRLLQNFTLFGVGIDNIHFIYPRYELLSYVKEAGAHTGVDRVHNEFLDVSIMRGILGGFLYLWLILSVIYLLWRNTKSKYRIYAAGLAGGIVAYIVQNQFSLAVVSIGLAFWLLVGVSGIIIGKNKKLFLPTYLFFLLFILGQAVLLTNAFIYYADKFYYRGDLFNALRLNPWERTYWGALFGKYIGEGKNKQAEYIARRAIEYINSENAFYNFLGVSLQRQNRIEEAINSYKKAIYLKPYFTDALYNLGSLCLRKGKLNEAKEAFQKAYLAAPTNKTYIENLLHLYKLMCRWDDAENLLEKLAESNFSTKSEKEWAYYELANIFWIKKDYISCAQACEALLKINPSKENIRKNLISLYKHYIKDEKRANYHASFLEGL